MWAIPQETLIEFLIENFTYCAVTLVTVRAAFKEISLNSQRK